MYMYIENERKKCALLQQQKVGWGGGIWLKIKLFLKEIDKNLVYVD